MIVRRIEVSGWRCFVEDAAVGPFTEGINVVFAPNGTGKSTLFEALCRGFLDGHRVTGREVELLRPWGRALSPRVAVEFFHDGVEYRMRKRFLEGACSTLERKEAGHFRPVAENDNADERVRALLTQNPPGRGLAQRRNWGLAQVLWAPQGNLALSDLTDDLGANIRRLLGAQVAGPGTGSIETKIEELYLNYFTPSGKLRSGRGAPKVVTLSERLQEARARLGQARDLQLAFEGASRRVEDLRSVREQARRDSAEVENALKGARERLVAYSSLRSEADQRQERARSSESQYRQVKQHVDLITRTDEDVKEARGKVADLEAGVPLIERECHARERELAVALAALEDARKGRERVTRAEAKAAAARKYVDATRDMERLSTTLKRIERAKKLLTERLKAGAELVAPAAEDLRAIRRLVKQCDEARLKVEASLITLEVVAEKSATVQVVAGEEPGRRKLAAGKPEQFKGSPEVVVDMPGVARLRARGPSGSIEENRAQVARAREKLAEKSARFGTEELEALEALAEKARGLEAKVAEARTQLETLLGGKGLEDLLQEQAAQKAVAAKMREESPEWADSPPDAEAAAARAEELRRAFISEVERKESEWTRAQAAFSATSGRKQASASDLEESRRRLSVLEARLGELTADGKKPEERAEELRRLLMVWEAATAGLEEIKKQLQAFGGDPAAEVKSLEKRLQTAGEETEKALGAERMEQGRLEQLSARGPYSELAAAEETVGELEREVAAERLRVDAVKLLHDTLGSIRAEALSCVAKPVEAVASRTFQRIAGRRLGGIAIDAAFQPSAVTPESAGAQVEIASLSGGELEQLYLATRLALAEVLSRGERQLVVLDDVLTATDAGRLARVMAVLEDAAGRLQILVLTCHPERYRGLDNAEFFDLEAVVAARGNGRRG